MPNEVQRKMKDSGIEWIGMIPHKWSITRCKYISSFLNGFAFDSKDLHQDFVYPVIRIGDINDGKVDITKCLGIDDNTGLNKYLICNNDILLAMSGATVGKVGIAEQIHNSYINQRVGIIRTSFPRFLFYCLSTREFIDYIILRANGSAQPNVSGDVYGEYIIPLPENNELAKIATFLDSKCAEIDSLRADIEKEIETLEEYKKSIITEAVTKGLDPNVPMKDSGIKWVGAIPTSWEIHPVYVYFNERKNKNYALQEQNLLSLSYGRIIRKDIDTVGGLLPASFNTYNIVEAGDIIIRPTDLQNDKRSLRTGLVTEKGIITSAYIDLAPVGNINSAYFHYLLHSYDVQKVFYNMGNGVRQGLNYSEFAKLMVFAPSRAEQDTIVSFLNSRCDEIETLITQKREQLATLDEYKKSIIYEYVTGKKEVPAV